MTRLKQARRRRAVVVNGSWRSAPPEVQRIAITVRWVREEIVGARRRVLADAVGYHPARIAAFETAWAGVPTRYVKRLLSVAELSPAAFMDALFAPAPWPDDPRVFEPLPNDARALESALRLWRLEPVAANASMRRLLEATLTPA